MGRKRELKSIEETHYFKSKRKEEKKKWRQRKKQAKFQERREKLLKEVCQEVAQSAKKAMPRNDVGTQANTAQGRGRALIDFRKSKNNYAHPLKELDATLIQPIADATELGRGTFGFCYLAKYRHTTVAVKELLNVAKKTKTDLRSDALREAKVLKDIKDHRGVPYLFGVCTQAEPIRIVIMFHGEGLKNLTISQASKEKSFRADVWKPILSLTCSALEHIHSCGYVHNDIKGNNVVLEKKGESIFNPVIIDFGRSIDVKLARPCKPRQRPTEAYLAPELYSGTAPPSFASDIFSLGKMIASVYKHTRCFSFGQVLRKCLEVNPTARPSLAEVISCFT